MITFILNNETITTEKPSGISLLDFIRYEMGLSGTKAGCREGDCGACTVLMGTLINGSVVYKSIVSCLTPLGNADGTHIVTIEGINTNQLSIVQTAMVENSATQCGFCTPGFVMSLTSECLSHRTTTPETVIESISGNICRCTGYKSIEKAAFEISEALKNKDISDPVEWLVKQNSLPEYFLSVPERLGRLRYEHKNANEGVLIAGGTDLMVQKADDLSEKDINTLIRREDLRGIRVENETLVLGSATTLGEIYESEVFRNFLPSVPESLKLIASEPVRNMATAGGNIVNASPIADFTIILLAFDSEVTIEGKSGVRTLKLKDLFEGYKKLGLDKEEHIKNIVVKNKPGHFNFEKVSKREHLDIASVNSAINIIIDNEVVVDCHISAGGVSPVPLYLEKTVDFLKGKNITSEIIRKAAEVMIGEITPISDIRGSSEYKKLLLRQLFFAHFIKLFPGSIILNDLV